MDNYQSTLRLNLLEILDYGKNRKNRKRYSLADILAQLHSIYLVAYQKPETIQIADAIQYLLERSLIENVQVGDVEMYYINDQGRDLLERIGEGDETAII